ncbi:O-acetylserine/cysteine efflux transporter [Herbaspirillum sp. 1173]|jgi:O-acetylserine/cysteine efflux transporter|uniref:DMT family transporter n=1 Tax=Herbaspirillum sp. 1173 TaxID=2817734 RepID=UPI000EB504E1|nr:EamA family transporter [Herbaspirillum sp. 1173]MDR6743161.1 O-acetylserine/cysteine efflux transporter [Herbaspirillum sp. 1173]
MSPKDLFAVLIAIAVWAGNIIAVKAGVAELPPLLMTAMRLAMVGIVLLPFAPPWRIARTQWKWIVMLSATFSTLHFSLMFIGLGMAEAGTGAILLQMGTPLAIVLGVLLFDETMARRHWVGLAVSLMGVAILTFSPSMPGALASFLLLGSALAWAASNIIVKHARIPDLMAMMCWSSLLGVPQVLLASWMFEHGQAHAVMEASWHAWLATAYCALGSSVLGYWIWYRQLERYPVSKLAPFSLLTPVLSTLLGVWLLKDSANLIKIIGISTAVLGVGVLNSTRVEGKQ